MVMNLWLIRKERRAKARKTTGKRSLPVFDKRV